VGLIRTHHSKGHRAEYQRRLVDSSGAAGPCKRLDPASGKVPEVVERSGSSPPTSQGIRGNTEVSYGPSAPARNRQ
jgi:hypothetical protein